MTELKFLVKLTLYSLHFCNNKSNQALLNSMYRPAQVHYMRIKLDMHIYPTLRAG